jgi:hypothetical protein
LTSAVFVALSLGNTAIKYSRAGMPSRWQLDKACDYALRIWPRLEMFLTHGQVELDTNLAENAMRPMALGRKKLAAHRRRKSRPQNRGRPERAGHLYCCRNARRVVAESFSSRACFSRA